MGGAVRQPQRPRSQMKFQSVCACAAVLAIATLAGCTGRSARCRRGQAVRGPGTRRVQRARDGGKRIRNRRFGDRRRRPARQARSGTAHPLDLSGSPQYYRARAPDQRAVGARSPGHPQAVRAVGSGAEFPGRGHRDHRLLQQRAGAGRDPARVVGLPGGRRDAGGAGDRDRRGAPARLQRHRRRRLDLDAGAPRLPPAADPRGDVDVHDALQPGRGADGHDAARSRRARRW